MIFCPPVQLAKVLPDGSKAILLNQVDPVPSVRIILPLVGSQSITILSAPPLASTPPAESKATHQTVLRCPASVRYNLPPAKSHNLTVESLLALAKNRPVGSKATLLTSPLCPINAYICWPVSASHSLIDLSFDGDARNRPSGDHAMRPTEPVCPRRVRRRITPGGSFFLTSSSACRHCSSCSFVAIRHPLCHRNNEMLADTSDKPDIWNLC